MNRNALLIRTLRHYWRTNLAVLLGVAVGTAVIAGALIVGDSVRASLRQMTLDRLGQIDYALSGGRFFREAVAEELESLGTLLPNVAGDEAVQTAETQVAPAILVTATLRSEIENDDSEETSVRIAGRVNLAACDERLWQMLETQLPPPADDEIVLNERVASQLGVEAGDELSLFVDIPMTIPQESLLGERDVDEQIVEFPLTVAAVVPPESSLGRFSLQPNQQLPLNAFMNLERLQIELDLTEQRATPRNPIAKPARANALLVTDSAYAPDAANLPAAAELTTQINEPVQQLWTLDDLFLHLSDSEDRGYFALESDRMVLEHVLSERAVETADQLSLQTSPVLVYLVNEISNAADPERYSMYSVAAGVEFAAEEPFGPFTNIDGQPVLGLNDREVAINAWLAEDLGVAKGDEIVVKYHVVGSRGELPEEELTFTVGAILALEGSPADDPGFTPFVEGITDADSLADWEQPFPMQMNRITERDDEYWDAYKTTPKLFLPLAAARELWQSRYGDTTSVRIAGGDNLEQAKSEFTSAFRDQLPYVQLGLTMLPVKEHGLLAAQGTQDFTGLFIGFSFFVIAAATVLIGLLFQLGVESRIKQMGLLAAVGFSQKQIFTLLLGEGFLVAIGGVIAGLFLAIGYGWLMIFGLTTWWRGAIGTSFLELSVEPASLLIGGAIALVVSLPGMWLGIRRLMKIAPKDQLHGVTAQPRRFDRDPARPRLGGKGWTGLALLAFAVLLVVGVLTGLIPAEQAFAGFNWQMVCFFLSGFASLIGCLLLFVVRLRAVGERTIHARGSTAAMKLGTRNLRRNRQRSTVTVILVSLATFVVVAVAAGRQNPTNLEPKKDSGNGGFALVAESARPVLYDITSESGQQKLGLIGSRSDRLREMLSQAQVMSFRVRPGEDASCLNLYQTRLPTILGVPQEMIDRGGFLFADTPGENPWKLLEGKTEAGHIPVLGDQNTLQYSLHKAIGSEIELPAELQTEVSLEVAGALSGSVFQGVLLMSEENFLELFPNISGYNYFLIDTPLTEADELTALLESGLIASGFDAELVGRRLQNFLAVQNTYLSTFQALGGLGLLLGTIGLGTVMLRNVLERRAELALMRAVGFGRAGLAIMVLTENAALLLLGLFIGTFCALLAMLPNISGRAGDVPWLSGGGLLLLVFAVGIVSASLAIIEAIRTPVLQTLRSE